MLFNVFSLDVFFIDHFFNNNLLLNPTLIWNFSFTKVLSSPSFIYVGVLFLLSTLFSLLFISFLSLYGVFLINIITLFLFWSSTLVYFFYIIQSDEIYSIIFGTWFYIFNNFPIFLELYVDKVSVIYSLLTLTISFFVQLYAFSYFRYEPLVERLIIFLNLFILSMIFFVISGNTIMLFLGWELIGLTSFVLINFWVTRKGTLKAAFKAFVFNKISDISFFLFIIGCIFVFNTTNIAVINNETLLFFNYSVHFLNFDLNLIELLAFLLIISAFIKSAQLGFHLWLPDSMEAPVPASALIHSATLVSAGLFLLLRFNSFFELSNIAIYIIPLVGSLTSCYGGLGAMFQSDVKRILAYSTISHCGFLITSFFFFNYEVTLFYLYVHGFFKAGVFLCVGNVIRFSGNYQDFRRMGGFFKYLTGDCYFIIIGLFNLGGLPFSLGFYMKHYFLVLIQQNTIFNSFILTFCLFGALTGVFYSFKLIDYVFFDVRKAKKIIYLKTNNFVFNYEGFKSLISNTTTFNFQRLKFNNRRGYIYRINSTLATISINFLFIFAYILCFYYIVLLKVNYSVIFSNNIMNSSLNDISVINLNLLFNLGFINWIIVFLVCSVFFSVWKELTQYIFFFKKFIFIILCSLILFVIL